MINLKNIEQTCSQCIVVAGDELLRWTCNYQIGCNKGDIIEHNDNKYTVTNIFWNLYSDIEKCIVWAELVEEKPWKGKRLEIKFTEV